MKQIFTSEIVELMEMMAQEVGSENGIKVVILPEDDFDYGYEDHAVSQLITPSLKENAYPESLRNKLSDEFLLDESDNETYNLMHQLVDILKSKG